MRLVAPPLYVLTTMTLNKSRGVELLNQAVEACQKSIEGNKGQMRIKESARAVSEKEERMLQEELEAAERANREVGGDSDSEEDEVGMQMDVNAAPALQI